MRSTSMCRAGWGRDGWCSAACTLGPALLLKQHAGFVCGVCSLLLSRAEAGDMAASACRSQVRSADWQAPSSA